MKPVLDRADMPARIRGLPVNDAGYPVPWFVATIDGKPDFRVIERGRIEYALRNPVCWVCGGLRNPILAAAFVIGPMCAVNRNTAEPPSHVECAVCPRRPDEHARRRDGPGAGVTDLQVPEEPTMAKAPVSRETTNGTKLQPIAGGGGSEPLTRTIVMLDVDRIDIGKNVRVVVEGVEDLAASAKEHGILQPIKVRPAGDRWEVVWGQRRLLAARMAGLERIPAITTAEEQSAAGRSIEQLAENLLRADLNPIDRAKAMRAVVDSGVKQVDLARQLGLAPSTIANDLGLLEAPPAVQKALADGKVSAAHARAIKGLPKADQVRLVSLAVQHGKSAHELESDAKYARQEVARQERDRGRLEKIGASAVAQLEKAVAKDALIVVSGAVVTNVIKKAGWTNIFAGDRWTATVVKKAGECGCTTWLVEYDTYSGKAEAKLKPACADAKHRAGRDKVVTDERVKARSDQDAAAAAYEAKRGEQLTQLTALLEDRLAVLPSHVQRALLWALTDDYHAGRGLRERHGGDPNRWTAGEEWSLVAGIQSGDVVAELALVVAEKITPAASYSAGQSAGVREHLLKLVVPEPADAAEDASPGRLPRGTCVSCAADVALRKGGLVREHGRYDPDAPGVLIERVCGGSGKAAAEAVPA